jgi:parvulin-like peptidyl-prolyl isomerase
MTRILRRNALLVTLFLLLPSLGACTDEAAEVATDADGDQARAVAVTETAAEPAAWEPMDVIAKVGDQAITFREITTMMNSAAIVGLSMPELGSPERDTVRITLLDKLISANLLYLDAVQKGVDQDPDYQQAMERFRDGVLVNLYRSKVLVGDIEVTDQDVEDFYASRIGADTELTDKLKIGIEATIRKSRVKERTATMRERLREGHEAAINVTDLDPGDDQVRSDKDVLAELDGVPITWGEARSSMQRAHTMQSTQRRIEALEHIIDTRIMVQKAKEAGLEQDPIFQARFGEFSKTRLINIHRGRLMESWEPTDEEIRAFYDANEDRMVVKEVRKLQMLVVENKEEAESLKQQIEANEITFHKAVADYSIIPDAKKTLGQIGWVTEGSGFPELDEVTFMLESGEIGGPVESPAGWHLVRVLDQRDAQHKNIADPETRKKARRLYLDEQFNLYVIKLRKESFPVEIDETMIGKLSQQEIDWYQEMLEKAQKSPEEVIDDIKRLQRGE